MIHPDVTVTGSNLGSTFPFMKGWCSPAFPFNVYDRSKSVQSHDLHFPTVVGARTDDRHPPVSQPVIQGVFN